MEKEMLIAILRQVIYRINEGEGLRETYGMLTAIRTYVRLMAEKEEVEK